MTKDKLPHAPEHWDKMLDQQFTTESDRACVILAAALLDSALETLLKTHHLPSGSGEDSLFDSPNAPLASFSARIEMAHRLALIDNDFARSLHLMRRIRNDFAHNVTGCTFADSSVMGRLTELRRVAGIPENTPGIRKDLPSGPRGDFQVIAGWMQWALRELAEDIDPVEGPQFSVYMEPPPPKKRRKARAKK